MTVEVTIAYVVLIVVICTALGGIALGLVLEAKPRTQARTSGAGQGFS
jgi:hypothetical protein